MQLLCPKDDWTKLGVFLVLAKILNQFRYWTFNGSFLITGLITTAVVAGVTPNIATRREPQLLHKQESYCLVYSQNGSNGWFNWQTEEVLLSALTSHKIFSVPISMPLAFLVTSHIPPQVTLTPLRAFQSIDLL